jgi:hypothetical protein
MNTVTGLLGIGGIWLTMAMVPLIELLGLTATEATFFAGIVGGDGDWVGGDFCAGINYLAGPVDAADCGAVCVGDGMFISGDDSLGCKLQRVVS